MEKTMLGKKTSALRSALPQVLREVDLSRGALHFNLPHLTVLLDEAIVRDYGELDPALGLNVCGQVLSVLGRHVAANRGGGPNDMLSVGLRRRADNHKVEVSLAVIPGCRDHREVVFLHKIGEVTMED
ncbi:MAG: hypothetical protein ABSH48_13450 [Verrucomicrobiota bacterium]